MEIALARGEYFKFMKQNTNLDNIKSTDEEKLRKSIYSQFIISQLIFLFQKIFAHEASNKKKKLNKTVFAEGFFQTSFVFHFFGKNDISVQLKRLILFYVKFVDVPEKERHYKRKCVNPNKKSYTKFRGKKKQKNTKKKKNDKEASETKPQEIPSI